MQKNALLQFRSGFLANSLLKSYLLDASNIEYEPLDIIQPDIYNEKLANNLSQKRALERALNEKNLYLIQGPPGTGKTTVIKEIIHQQMELNPASRVLVVSQANVAVDNVLRGLKKDYRKQMIRCGHLAKIDESIVDISFEEKYEHYIKSIKSYSPGNNEKNLYLKWLEVITESDNTINPDIGELILKDHQIVGATCVGLAQKKIGLNRIIFDLVIIDEASKALPAEILIPVNRAKKVILIGDHKQLPPVINPILYDEEKIELSDREYMQDQLFSLSMFQKLYEAAPESNKSILESQYRMPSVIGEMVSELFYGGLLKNGKGTDLKKPIYFKSNLNIIDMSKDKTYKESKENGMSVVNYREAQIVNLLVEKIRKETNVSMRIAVITPYRGQKRAIVKALMKNGINLSEENIAVNTIDAFQGDEAELVIYCTTRANKKTLYFSDDARLNVAFSRAKNSLVIIGSMNYFKKYGPESNLRKIAEYIEKNGSILNYKVLEQDNSMKRVNLRLIEILNDFKETPPAEYKVEWHVNYYLKSKSFDKPIVVEKNARDCLVLKNGYARYLAAKQLGLEYVEVVEGI